MLNLSRNKIMVRTHHYCFDIQSLFFNYVFVECITAIRNIFDMHLCPLESSAWNESLDDIPLESDERLLDYLHKFNYDSQKALFNLLVELGRGKGNVYKSTLLFCQC